jgi:histone H3/H4
MAKQKTKPTKITTEAQESLGSLDHLRLLEGGEVERDTDIDIQTQQQQVTPLKKRREKKKQGIVLESPRTRSADRGIKRKAPATTGARKKMYSHKGHEFTMDDLISMELMVSDKQVIPKASFLKLVKEIIRNMQPDFRLSLHAFEILHEVAEHEMTNLFWVANTLATTHKKVTIGKGDFELAALITKIRDPNVGFHMHTAYNVKKVLDAYNVHASVRSDVIPLEECASYASKVIQMEKDKKKKKNLGKQQASSNEESTSNQGTQQEVEEEERRPVEEGNQAQQAEKEQQKEQEKQKKDKNKQAEQSVTQTEGEKASKKASSSKEAPERKKSKSSSKGEKKKKAKEATSKKAAPTAEEAEGVRDSDVEL